MTTAKNHKSGRFATLRDGLITVGILLVVWSLAVRIFAPPPFILPGPERVLTTLFSQVPYLAGHGWITLIEILMGLAIGTLLGVITAISASLLPVVRRFVMPLVATSQALPVFAIAPLLIVWFGLGLGSKVAMATLIIYFPIASALYDGLMRTNRDMVDLARTFSASKWQMLHLVRLPAAMPDFASGLRVAVTIAPIGAVVGEWVGASAGLGYVINQANARMQTDTVFAGLVVLAAMAIVLRAIVNQLLNHFIHWTPKTAV